MSNYIKFRGHLYQQVQAIVRPKVALRPGAYDVHTYDRMVDDYNALQEEIEGLEAQKGTARDDAFLAEKIAALYDEMLQLGEEIDKAKKFLHLGQIKTAQQIKPIEMPKVSDEALKVVNEDEITQQTVSKFYEDLLDWMEADYKEFVTGEAEAKNRPVMALDFLNKAIPQYLENIADYFTKAVAPMVEQISKALQAAEERGTTLQEVEKSVKE